MRTLFDGLEPAKMPPGTLRDRVRPRALRLLARGGARSLNEAIDRILKIKRRTNRNDYSGKYVRLVRSKTGGVLFQARAWHPYVGSVNIGLFRSEREATQAARNWMRAGCDPCLGLSEGVLPKWVRAVEGGYQALYRTGGRVHWEGSVHAEAVAAHREIVEWLTGRGVLPVQGRPAKASEPQPSLAVRQMSITNLIGPL